MFEISFKFDGNNSTEMMLVFQSGEMTKLFFNTSFPYQAQALYVQAIGKLEKTRPDISKQLSNEEELFSTLSWWFTKNNLPTPIGFETDTNEDRIRLSKRLREIREMHHLYATQLANITGINAANICRIEQGKHSIGIDNLSRIANAMGYKIDLVKINDNKNRDK